MILQEELQKLLLMAPLALVIILNGVGLAGSALRRRALRNKRGGKRKCKNKSENGEKQPAHKASTENLLPIVSRRLYAHFWERDEASAIA